MKRGTEKMVKNTEKNNFYKTNPSGGISLIVLVITIIVVIILAVAVIISLQNNNPMVEANKARIESDVANMQAIFTNTVGKIMAEKQDTLVITAGKLNSVTSGAKSAVGNAVYTLADGTSGEIIFDELLNDEEKYYTGSKLPLYKQKTAWYVDEQGLIAVEVGNKKYGEGMIVKSIKISTEVTPVEEYIITKVKVKIEIEYEDEVESIKFGGEDVTIPQKQDGKYVVEKEVTENGTYEIEVNGQNEVKNTATVEVNQIDEMSKQINIATNVDLSEKYSAKVRIEVSSVDEIKSITFAGVSVSGIQVIDGKYVGEVTVAENGTYEVEAKGKSGSKNKVSLTITKIQIDNRIEIIESTSPMLQSWVEMPTTDFHNAEYRKKITKIKFAINVDKTSESGLKAWDVSNAKDKSVMAWVESDGNSGYILTIAGKNKIIANPDSRYLFRAFTNVEEIENFELLDTSNVTQMNSMFTFCENLNKVNFTACDISKVYDMQYIFQYCSNLTSIGESDFNLDTKLTKTLNSMQGSFYRCYKLTTTLNIIGSKLNVGNKFYDNNTFNAVAILNNTQITLNYTAENESVVDNIIATKSTDSNIVKGTLIQ